MHDRAAIRTALAEVVAADMYIELPAEGVDPAASLHDVYGVDSLGFLELRTQCEMLFGVEITDQDFNPSTFHSIDTVSDLVISLRERAA